jgi:hypothetical protein
LFGSSMTSSRLYVKIDPGVCPEVYIGFREEKKWADTRYMLV